jgi:hypothetical protein
MDDVFLESKTSQVLDVFRRVLRTPHLSPDDNLFEYGCTSMVCLRAVLRLNDAGIKITVFDAYRYRTIRRMTRAVVTRKPTESGGSQRQRSVRQLPGGGPTLTPTARFLVEKVGFGTQYNVSMMWSFDRGQFSIERFSRAVSDVVVGNPALRATIVTTDKGVEKRQVEPRLENLVEIIDLSAATDGSQRELIERTTARVQREFSFSTGDIMIRFIVLSLPEGNGRVFVVAHHLLLDGVSFSLLARELGRAYRSAETVARTQSVVASADPRDWPKRLHRYANEDAIRELPLWREMRWDDYANVRALDGGESDSRKEASFSDISAAELHRQLQQGRSAADLAELEADQAVTRGELDRDTSERFLAMFGDRSFEIVLAAIYRVVMRHTSARSLWIDSFDAMRGMIFEDIDVSRVIGYINEIVPIALTLDLSEPTEVQLRAIRSQRTRLPRRGLGFRALKYLAEDQAMRREADTWPFPRIGLNYLVSLNSEHPAVLLDLPHSEEWVGPEIDESRTPYLLCFIFSASDGRVVVETRYAPREVSLSYARTVVEDVIEQMTTIIRNVSRDEPLTLGNSTS